MTDLYNRRKLGITTCGDCWNIMEECSCGDGVTYKKCLIEVELPFKDGKFNYKCGQDALNDIGKYFEEGDIKDSVISKYLNTFLEDRKDKFKNITKNQIKNWESRIEDNLSDMLGDNDLFYDNMPSDVEELL